MTRFRFKVMVVAAAGILVHLTVNCSALQIPYDMREDLEPRRMTIAMWDYSWLYGHYPGGPFEDLDKATNELIERRFNTVRIDAFPLLIAELDMKGESTYVHPADPTSNWGPSEVEQEHNVVEELLEFMRITKRKGIYVILSSWGQGDRASFTEREVFWKAWERVIDLLGGQGLLDHVVYIDLDQEFPYFSPFRQELSRLGRGGDLVPRGEGRWNVAQMAFVRDYHESTLKHFQKRYPGLRFTFSQSGFWEEVRSLGIRHFDVLEVHIWMDQTRFNVRTDFDEMTKKRDTSIDYSKYMEQVRATLKAMRPMLLRNMHSRLAFAKEWAEEIGAPLVTTEAYGPYWHMDHPDLEWDWLYDWCEECMALTSQYQFWGSTPWNFCHPFWDNWPNVDWYRKVNGAFLEN